MDIEKVKRYSLIELALLGVFFIGLLISGLIVKVRTRVLLSEPLGLSGSGVTVCMPANPGWERTPGWQYEESADCMAMIGQFRSSARGGVEVRWRYHFTTPAGSEKDLLQQQAERMGAAVMRFDTTGRQDQMVFAKMMSGSIDKEQFYVGLQRLDFGRSVELLVKAYGMNSFLEDNIFLSLAQSMTYQKPDGLSDGRAFVDAFLQETAESAALTDESYLIKDVRGSVLGYYYARQTLHNSGPAALRRFQIRHLDKKAFTIESGLWFDPAGKTYRWESTVDYPGVRDLRSYQVERDDDGILTVNSNSEKKQTFASVHFFLPEPLLTRAAVSFIRGSYDIVVVDVVSAGGQLVPVRLEKIDPQQSKARSDEVASAVRIDYLHRDDSFEDLLFDASFNLLGKFEQSSRRRVRIWDAVAPEELQDSFQINFQELFDEVAQNTIATIETKHAIF